MYHVILELSFQSKKISFKAPHRNKGRGKNHCFNF